MNGRLASLFNNNFANSQPFALVMEKINGPSVESFLRNEGKDADNLFRMKILIDAARGMKYLHSQQPPFLHLDFASRNLLINWTTRRHSKENCIVKVSCSLLNHYIHLLEF